ncbi:MAG: beta-galactosidase [Treponema sp.]|nr:beta-galactosidase [Treponema sp.]
MNYSYDRKSLLRTDADKNQSRWFPIMGEIHYSRYPDSEWRRELLKMKAGGVDIVSAYTIWIHHEEVEDEWDFSGCRDLRKFVSLIGDCGLTMMLRIGPWCHGEVRNGGFPDWLLKKCPENRCDNPAYLDEVRKFYSKLYEQVDGLLLKDGGPIIGVQIENEYGHCGGLSGAAGEAHMRSLTALAKETGFDVPLYTATGWGGAVTAGLLPVMGGYCEAPWDPRVTEIEPSGNYLFSYERNDHAIGSDFGLGEGITFDMDKVPYLTAELGGGLQVTYKRRPVARAADLGAMSLAKLGSGCTLLGYYMYHGGMNPDGRLTTLEENKASGSLNDLLVKNYDFLAPLGEYGNMNGSYKEIRMLSLFLKEWGGQLCGMDAHIPDDAPKHPEDYASLRYSWLYDAAGPAGTEAERHAGAAPSATTASASAPRSAEASTAHTPSAPGFLFVNNFQRRRDMAEHDGVSLNLPAELGGGSMPTLDIYNGDYFFLPVNMRLGESLLTSSACTPLTVLDNKGTKTYVFYKAAHLAGLSKKDRLYRGSSVCHLQDADGRLYTFDAAAETSGENFVATLSRTDALNALKLQLDGGEYLVISEFLLFPDGDGLYAESLGKLNFKTYPRLPNVPEGFSERPLAATGFWMYEKEEAFPSVKTPLFSYGEDESSTATTKRYRLTTGDWNNTDWDELFLSIEYSGNCARLYENGKLLDDQIYTGPGTNWQVGLKRFGRGKHELLLEVDALNEDDETFLEEWPSFETGKSRASLDSVSLKGKMLEKIL